MIQVLNADKIKNIISYFLYSNSDYCPNNLKELLSEHVDSLRNMIFHEYVLPVATIDDGKISKIVLFDMKDVNEKSRNIQIIGGNTEIDFLKESIKEMGALYNIDNIKKVTVRGDYDDLLCIALKTKQDGFFPELDIQIGPFRFVQFSAYIS